jgi:ribonuclease D
VSGYELIQTNDQLDRLVAHLRRAQVKRLAIDVEGENNLHRYGIHVALIQLHDGARGFIVDPLALADSNGLKPLLERAPWELIWFDAGNDLLSFQHALGIRPSPILDLVVAARLLGKNGGLHDLTGEGGSAREKDRFQRANWLRRPLSPALLDYAISDVLHLHELADTLLAELEKRGLAEAFRIKNQQTQDAERSWDPFANYVRIAGYNRMSKTDRRIARVLWHARELYGRDHDLPPGNVASKQDMGVIVDRGLRTGQEIAAFLNERRAKNRVVPLDLARCLAEAEKQVPRDG